MFGLGLEENEVFIRWLLIERAKYFKKYPERRKKTWYVVPQMEQPDSRMAGKMYFLRSIGFEIMETRNYDDIYAGPWGN
jgi:hypothetical protein